MSMLRMITGSPRYREQMDKGAQGHLDVTKRPRARMWRETGTQRGPRTPDCKRAGASRPAPPAERLLRVCWVPDDGPATRR
ncbi:hypothetical protein GCM10028802_27560 [Terrabacter terrigena]